MGDLWIVFTAVLPIFGIMGLGLLLRRGRVLNREADESVLRIVINVLIPCLIWDAILGNPALDDPRNAWLPPIIGFGTVAAGIFIAWLVAKASGLTDIVQRRSFALAAGLYNWAYLALPLCVILFGKEVVGVLFVHNLGVEICLWTVGVIVLSGKGLRDGWKRVLNGPVIAIISAMIFNGMGAADWLPPFFLKGVSMLGASAIPIGLLLVGATFWDHLGEAAVLRHPRVGLSAVMVRLLVMPLFFLTAAYFLPVSDELKCVMVIQAAMPSAVFPVILAKHYGGHVPTTLRVVMWTTVLGFITMPLWINFGIRLFGLQVLAH
jgi:hypothetical protein